MLGRLQAAMAAGVAHTAGLNLAAFRSAVISAGRLRMSHYVHAEECAAAML